MKLTGIFIDGSLNYASDIDQGWRVEMAIPIASLMPRKFVPVKNGDYWRINFSRVHWDQHFVDGRYRRDRDDLGDLKKEYNWVWSEHQVVNMHEPEKWGYAYFTNDPVKHKNSFIVLK